MIKALVVSELLSKDTRQLRALIKTQPTIFKGKTHTIKSRNKEYRKWFFFSSPTHFRQFKVQFTLTLILILNIHKNKKKLKKII